VNVHPSIHLTFLRNKHGWMDGRSVVDVVVVVVVVVMVFVVVVMVAAVVTVSTTTNATDQH